MRPRTTTPRTTAGNAAPFPASSWPLPPPSCSRCVSRSPSIRLAVKLAELDHVAVGIMDVELPARKYAGGAVLFIEDRHAVVLQEHLGFVVGHAGMDREGVMHPPLALRVGIDRRLAL